MFTKCKSSNYRTGTVMSTEWCTLSRTQENILRRAQFSAILIRQKKVVIYDILSLQHNCQVTLTRRNVVINGFMLRGEWCWQAGIPLMHQQIEMVVILATASELSVSLYFFMVHSWSLFTITERCPGANWFWQMSYFMTLNNEKILD